jgi:hypothetical protein
MRRVIILLIIVSMFLESCSSDNYIRTLPAKGGSIHFPALGKDEILFYTMDDSDDNNLIEIFTVEGRKYAPSRKIAEWPNVSQSGTLQFSRDRRSCLFETSTTTMSQPLYLLDGNKGELSYVSDMRRMYISTYNLDKLVYEDTDWRKRYGSARFVIVDTKSLKEVATEWKTDLPIGSAFSLKRDSSDDTRIRILLGVEEGELAELSLSITTGKLTIIWDERKTLNYRSHNDKTLKDDIDLQPNDKSLHRNKE